ncbi:UDP-glucose dehydrogenase family protein [Rathayibacter toxicus]|uniref:UDP-glucose 6-dehydrogenase n=1 Tax=Rathayibacter toxicus TaxID=145458 RepID=A0A0C5BTX5_9MICO|nr:UDP-glucose/GDP-mannose dehydrogenase family protein [Rathayibacter toxicus]AJM78092.1 UDP-glucose 6-dehydrogenase [Rathayibacter toxicus]ALS57658.1 UDP-glucose 6-dehydrogenase [Rathayibacter toxicus]KKM45005.1 UDP-glucose 6-dehydrogenase [Rathayibacter toxicus]PPG20670.1 UDP-glucose/GDP-mannose dehydrogenase family protein [Rathayibacter toxicus]PPG45774.1 UDP-glucose/GDP-mannose dehydrogenase family protein [Rathayibacter toxicus]
MKLSVIGCGYLGAVHAAAMAELGHEVVGIDVDPGKIDALSGGTAPFFEPGLPELLSSGIASGRLRFSTNMADIAGSTVHFVAVGTPQKPGEDAADLRFVDSAVESLVPYLVKGAVVVGKSTVPVGTAARLAEVVTPAGATLAWNPEFLREGFAVQDTISPDRLVYGVPAGEAGMLAQAALDQVYARALAAKTPLIVTDYATAELVKVSANAFLATKISFINAIAEISEVTGADITQIADAIGYDNRIGRRFLNAGIGFGGGCLPKDIRAFVARAEELGVGNSLAFLREVDAINRRRRFRVIDIVMDRLGGSLEGRTIAVLGLSFKPESDDVRDSPSLDVVARFRALGATVRATDPQAIDNARQRYPDVCYTTDLDEVFRGVDAVVVATEWKQFRAIDPAAAAQLVGTPFIVDGRNCLDANAWRAAGWDYHGVGRCAL